MKVKAYALAVCLAGAATVAWSGAAAAADYTVVDMAIPKSLTGVPGDPQRGAQVVINRRLGNCLSCHANTGMAEHPFHGEIGPPLDGVAERWSEGELRLIVANPKEMFPGTIMPAFHRTTGLNRVLDDFQGKPILSAQELEDVLAYLMTLK